MYLTIVSLGLLLFYKDCNEVVLSEYEFRILDDEIDRLLARIKDLEYTREYGVFL